MFNESDLRVADLVYEERLAEAEYERLVTAVRRASRPHSLRVRCGRMLVWLGARLAGIASTPHESGHWRESESGA